MTHSVTLTPERTSYKLMHLRWTTYDPHPGMRSGGNCTMRDEHPEVIKEILRRIGLSDDNIEKVLYVGATLQLTETQMTDLGIGFNRTTGPGIEDAPLNRKIH